MDRRQLLNDEETATRVALDGALSSVWTALPAIVTSVNYEKRTCEAQPAIQGKTQKPDGTFEFVNLPLLVDCPIVFPSAGGFTLSMPIKAGDEVLIIFASRCIDSWWETGDIGVPMEQRMHDLSDGFAIPGPRSMKNVTPLHEENVQLMNDDQSVGLEIYPNGIVKLKASASIQMQAPDVIINGNLAVSGTAQIEGINFGTHKHSTSTNPSGVPVP